jgi:ATP-dependent protease Clp ATPase subunit
LIRRIGDGPLYCSFCKKGQRRGRKVIRRADGLYICDECVDRVIAALSGNEIERLSHDYGRGSPSDEDLTESGEHR